MAAREVHHTPSEDSSSGSPVDLEKRDPIAHIEQVHTNERVDNPNYYEKDGLRTYGDDEDHEHEPPVCLVTLACAKALF